MKKEGFYPKIQTMAKAMLKKKKNVETACLITVQAPRHWICARAPTRGNDKHHLVPKHKK